MHRTPVPALADHVRDRTCEQAHENQAKELRTRELREERREQIGQCQQAQYGAEEFERECDSALGVQEIPQVHSTIQRG